MNWDLKKELSWQTKGGWMRREALDMNIHTCEGSRKKDGKNVRMIEDIWCDMRLGFMNTCEDHAQRVEFPLYGHF